MRAWDTLHDQNLVFVSVL